MHLRLLEQPLPLDSKQVRQLTVGDDGVRPRDPLSIELEMKVSLKWGYERNKTRTDATTSPSLDLGAMSSVTKASN
jgi:hypothetical protein